MTYRRSFHSLLLLVLALLIAAPARADRVQAPSGDLRRATANDLKPQLPASGTNNEFWTYSIHLDGGIQLLVNFSRASFSGLRDAASGADLTVMGFDGETYHVARQYDAGDLQYNTARHRLQVHPNIWAEGQLPNAHRLYFETEKGGVSYLVDLTFSSIKPGVVWGDGVFRLGNERVGMFIHIPSARVRGTVRVNGVAKQVSGTAYMDHTFMTAFAPKLVSGGFRYATTQNGVEAGYVMVSDKRYDHEPLGYGVVEKNGQLVLRKPTAITLAETNRPSGVTVPTQLEVRFNDGSLVLNRRYDLFQRSALAEASGISRTLARKFLGGEVWYFRGRGTLDGDRRMYFSYFVVS